MKKFIVAIDGLNYSTGAADYATRLSGEADAHLVGVFLDDFTYHSYKIYNLVGDELEDIMRRRISLEAQDEARRSQATEYFEEDCRKAGINHSIHHDRNVALQELLHESIYADLLIIDKKETLTHYKEEEPTRFVKALLADVQCPVLVVPHKYLPVKEVILLYDGSPSSVHAIRTFSSVFSALNVPVEVLTIRKNGEHQHVPDNRLMKEFMKRHYPNAAYKVFNGDPSTEIVRYLRHDHENAIVVLGAYQRSAVSRWFKPSMADILMKQLEIPLFIAHNK